MLAYDIGTSYLKGAVVTSSGKVVSRAQVPVRLREARDPAYRVSDPDDWLAGLAIVTAELGLREKGRIRGVVVSANGPTLLAVDAAGEPLGLRHDLDGPQGPGRSGPDCRVQRYAP